MVEDKILKENGFRDIQGVKDIGKEVFFYDYTKKEFYIKGILDSFDYNIYCIKLPNGEIKNYQTGFIKEK